MRDFLPADVRRREYVIGVIKEVYERYGFEPLETPAVENIETLMGKYGEEGNQLIYKILKRGVHESTGEADLALRYDLTVPLARVVAAHRDKLPKFFKRYQIQPVWRADRPARGRFREFYQCDVDVLGSKSPIVEAELCASVSDVLVRLGFKDFTIRLNHRQLLDAMMSSANIEREKRSSCLVILDKLDKIGVESFKNELAKLEISANSIETLLHLTTNKNFLALGGKLEPQRFSEDNVEANQQRLALILRSFKDLSGEDDGKKTAYEAVGNLSKIVDLLKTTSAAKHVQVDPLLARGLSYYTGAIMEVRVPDLTGSLGGGGRYDNLVGMFSKQDVPACGFSLGMERIIYVMSERNMFPTSLPSSAAEVMIGAFDEESTHYSIELASELRKQGLRVFVYPEAANPGKQLSYARDCNIPFMIVVGQDERETGELILRNTKIRGGEKLPREKLAETIKRQLEFQRHEEQVKLERLAYAIEEDLSESKE